MHNTFETALLLVDLQEPLLETISTQSAGSLRRSLRALLMIANTLEIRVVASTIPLGGKDAMLLSEISELSPTRVDFPRACMGPADDPGLSGYLLGNGISRVVIAGIATEVAVRQAALGVKGLGFAATVVVDVCSGISDRGESAVLAELRHAGVQVTTVPSLGGEWAGDLSSPAGQAVMAAMRTLLG